MVSLKEFVTVKDSVKTWEEAIEVAAKPLLESGYINENYIQQMIRNVRELGPYIVIMPQVALPHARSECGALKTGVSILKLDKPVVFPADQAVELLVVLSAEDDVTHMGLLSEIADLLMDEQRMKKVWTSSCRDSLLEALS